VKAVSVMSFFLHSGLRLSLVLAWQELVGLVLSRLAACQVTFLWEQQSEFSATAWVWLLEQASMDPCVRCAAPVGLAERGSTALEQIWRGSAGNLLVAVLVQAKEFALLLDSETRRQEP